jgi:hypothetical protein
LLCCRVPCHSCVAPLLLPFIPFPVYPCLFISSSYLFYLYLIVFYLWYCSSIG